jgi:hypothetical protein
VIDPAHLEKLGVWQDADGRYKRNRIRVTNPEYDPSDPKAELKGLLVSYDEEEIAYPVVLPLATDPDSIEEARRKAASTGADFYHPKWGWLRWGIKPERDHPENLGSGSQPNPRRRVTLAPVSEPTPEPETTQQPAAAAPALAPLAKGR